LSLFSQQTAFRPNLCQKEPELMPEIFSQSSNFLDYKKIIYKPSIIIQPDTFSIQWGLDVLSMLELKNLSTIEKARKINQFLYKNFKFKGNRYFLIQDIIHKKKGNCRSHGNISIFVLRMAGIPAKYAHEMHITMKSLHSRYIGYNAKKANEGINGYAHNDHLWVWFLDGNNWLPFDSSLGIVGFDELFAKRFFNRDELNKKYIEKVTGPPFVIWEDIGFGLDSMANVSKSFWMKMPERETPVNKSEWVELSANFDKWNRKDLYNNGLPTELYRKIKEMSGKFFGKKF